MKEYLIHALSSALQSSEAGQLQRVTELRQNMTVDIYSL